MSSEFGFHTTGQEVIDAFSSSIAGKTSLYPLNPLFKEHLTNETKLTVVLTGPTPTSLGAKAIELLASHPTSKPARIILLGRSLEKTSPLISKRQ